MIAIITVVEIEIEKATQKARKLHKKLEMMKQTLISILLYSYKPLESQRHGVLLRRTRLVLPVIQHQEEHMIT
jgi:hypothetical protein